MSFGDKVKYGGSPPSFNLNCAEDPQVIADGLNDLWEAIYVLGGGYVPAGGPAADIPPSNPSRHKVRFRTTEAMGATASQAAAAVVVDGDGADIAGEPAFTAYDSLDNYSSASSGKFGWAEYIEYPDGDFRLEIITLGGEGTVTGSGDDEKVKVTSNDTTAGYMFDKVDAWGGAPSYSASSHQQVWAAEQNDGGAETVRFFTSKVSTTQTHEVLVSATDSTKSYLFPAISAGSQETAAFDGGDHQRVYARVDNGGGDESLSLYAKRSEETGKVRKTDLDTLEYLTDKIHDHDAANLYNASAHDLVVVGPESDDAGNAGAGTDYQYYVAEPRVKLDTASAPVFAEDLFIDSTGTAYSPSLHNLVRFNKVGSQLRAYTNLVGGGGGSDLAIVTAYHSSLASGKAVDPVSGRYFKGSLDGTDDIWIESLDTHGNSGVLRPWLPANGELLGLSAGSVDVGGDVRDLYKVQPPAPGVLLALVTGVGTQADWSNITEPTMGSAPCTIYKHTEAGGVAVHSTSVSVIHASETQLATNSILYVQLMEGYYHVVAQLCEAASGGS